jgi:hypothetical protein
LGVVVKLIKSVLFAAVIVSGSVMAQSANDNGVPATSQGPFLVGGRAPTGVVCPTGVTTSSFGGVNTQSGRIFRDAIPSACPSKVYPGIFNAGTTYNYESFTYSNTSAAAACVTVNFDPNTGTTPCGTNAHASAYLGTYDPANQGTNYVGDVGSSVTQPFSFEVPANSDMVLVVTNTASAAICDFTFEVVNLPCTAVAPLEPQRPVPANDRRALALLAALIVLVGSFVVARTRH